MPQSLTEILDAINKTNSWFIIIDYKKLQELLIVSEKIYSTYLLPQIERVLDPNSIGYKNKLGLKSLAKIMNEYKTIENNINKIIWFNKILQGLKPFLILSIIFWLVGLIGLFLGKKDELLGLFPKILVENKFFDLNILHFLFITFLIIIVLMIFFRITGQYLLEEIFEKSFIHDSNNKKFSDDEINNKNKDFENDENKLLN
jgi:hypothetical protein